MHTIHTHLKHSTRTHTPTPQTHKTKHNKRQPGLSWVLLAGLGTEGLGRGFWFGDSPLTTWMAIPLEHEVNSIYGPG